MKRLEAIIEDSAGNVVGAQTDQGEIRLAPEEIVPRGQLRAVAVTLATKYGVDPASFTLPAGLPSNPLPPAE
jgi:hypothetical protein